MATVQMVATKEANGRKPGDKFVVATDAEARALVASGAARREGKVYRDRALSAARGDYDTRRMTARK